MAPRQKSCQYALQAERIITMNAALNGLIPVFLIIALGWGIRAFGIVKKNEWRAVSRLAYWAMIPAVLFSMIARIEFYEVEAGPLFGATACGFITMGVLAYISRLALKSVDGPTYSSFVQGSVRWNGFVLLAAAPFLFGPQGEALTALVFAASVPIANIFSVSALYIWAQPAKATYFSILWRLVKNPLILSSVAGVLWALANLPTTGPAFNALDIVGRAGLATMLLCVGSSLELGVFSKHRPLLVLTTIIKLLVMPLVMWLAALMFGLSPLATTVLVAAGATPGATASYILAQELGGNTEFTAAHITATTILSLFVLPIAISLVN